jgi:serine protease inhibitor
MKTRTWMILGLLALAVAAPTYALMAMPPQRWIAEQNSVFATELYTKLSETDGNLFFSPHSISTALAMTYAGARGNTAAEMAKTMHFPLPNFIAPPKPGPNGLILQRSGGRMTLHQAFKLLQADILRKPKRLGKDQTPLELSIANALWPQKDYRFLAAYLKTVGDNYQAGLQELDYKTDPDAARKVINDWVAEQTKDKIKDLLPPQSLNAMTRLVLTNAVYFKGGWVHQFKKTATKDAAFWTTPAKSVDVPTMHQTERFGYNETAAYQTLTLPYAGNTKSMVIVLPKKRGGLAAIEKSLVQPRKVPATDRAAIRKRNEMLSIFRPGRPAKVQVSLPKFKFESQFELGATLQAMGMKDAFTYKADFSGMTGTLDLYISKVIHKAFVDVNEEGTEAAAATAVVMMLKGIDRPEQPKVFNADHPFLFAIRDNTTGAILFMGRVVNP